MGNTTSLPGQADQVKLSHEFQFSIHCIHISPVQVTTFHYGFSGHHLETNYLPVKGYSFKAVCSADSLSYIHSI